MRKWMPKEKTSERDKLGLNTAQYANELHKPHLIPFLEGLEDPPSHIYLVADGAGYHNGKQNKELQLGVVTTDLNDHPTYQISTQLRTIG
jgi:hypothetical protein